MINLYTSSSLQKSPEYAVSSKNECWLGETDDNGEFDIFQQLEKNVKSAFCLSVLASVSPYTNVGIELEFDSLLTTVYAFQNCLVLEIFNVP